MKSKEEREEAARLGARLEEVRKSKGLSRESVARISGLTLDTILKIEKGLRSPRTVTLVEICRALGVQPGTVLDEEEAS